MNGSNTQTDTENGRWCDICAQNGHKVKLQYFQINYEDAILICPVKECTYPLDSKPLDNIIVKRKPEDIVNSIKRKRRKLDHTPLGKEVNPFISKISLPYSELVCEGSSLRSSALDSLTAKIIENISQNSAISRLSLPVYNGFVSNIFSIGFASESNSQEQLHASVTTNSSILPDITSLCPVNVKTCEDFVPSDYLAHVTSLANVEHFSNQCLPENVKNNILNSESLLQAEEFEVNASTLGPSECESKKKALAATTAELVDTDAYHNNTDCHGPMNELSYAELSLNSNSVNPIALDPKNQAKASKQNAMILGKLVSVGAKSAGNLNKCNMDSVVLSNQNSLISVKQDSMKYGKSDPLYLTEPNASCVVNENSLLDSGKHFKAYHSVNDDERCSTEKDSIHNESKSVPSKEVYFKFLQWKNKDSLCWLDVVMCLLMHGKTLRLWLSKTGTETCLKSLLGSFDISQRLFRQGLELRRCVGLCRMGRTVKLETSVGDVMVKTGGGNSSDILFGAKAIATIAMDEVEGCSVEEPFDVRNIFSREDPNTVSIEKMLQEADRLDSLSKKTLSDARESIFASLESSLHCKKGQNDSPLMALTELLTKDPVGESLKMHYCWTLHCSACDTTHQDSVSKEVVTFLKLPENFRISEPCFMRSCFSCKAADQLLCIEFDRLPDLFFHHFLEGVHHCDLADLDFEFNGDKYAVTGLVQYKTNPDHFVSWLREPVVDFWMECDDLKNCVCKYSGSRPTIPASQVHIVMWEKQSKNSGYRLPCERESVKQVGKVQQSVVDHVLSNQFPPSAMTSLPTVSANTTRIHIPATSLPAATLLRPSLGKNGAAAVSASVQVAPVKDQDENCSKLCRKMPDITRLQRMKQKYELDRKRSSSLNSSKPVIPRIPIGISTASEQPERKNVHYLPGKMELSAGKYSPSKIAGCIFTKKLSRTSVQGVVHENNAAKSNVLAGRHNIAAVQTRSLLKVGRQSYLDSILPLITERKQSATAVQKFEAYVPKSQKMPPASTNETVNISVTDRGNTAFDIKTRKPRVCFSECNLPNDKQYQLQENVTNELLVSQMPTKSGILARPSALPKSMSRSEHKFCFDDAEFDFSNFMDLDKILFEDNSLVAENTVNSTSVACSLLQHNDGDASKCIFTTIESCASGSTSTNGNGLDVLSVMRENTSDFESTVFGDVAVHSLLPNFDGFIPSDNWTSSLSGSAYINIISDCANASVVNSSLTNNAIDNCLHGNTSSLHGCTGINDSTVTDISSGLYSSNDLAEDVTNLPLPVQSFNFGEEDWSWYSESQ